MRKTLVSLVAATVVTISTSLFSTAAFAEAPTMDEFLAKMHSEHDFDPVALRDLLENTKRRDDILKAISTPAEGLPWHRYRPIFLKPKRINDGVDFWLEYEDQIKRAEQEFQVPAEIIVAIIGVETFYGRIQGKYPVLEALYTLGFHYPKRAKFFSKELENFLLLSREQGWQLGDVKGSYAGAMGMGQFIPSSYRHYAVDFDGDAKIDLMNNPIDAIGSVANYFKQHKWQLGEPVIEKVKATEEIAKSFAPKRLKVTHELEKISAAGVTFESVSKDGKGALFGFEQPDGMDHWLGFSNFYVITRYNRSPLYALAVHQLSQEIKSAVASRKASMQAEEGAAATTESGE